MILIKELVGRGRLGNPGVTSLATSSLLNFSGLLIGRPVVASQHQVRGMLNNNNNMNRKMKRKHWSPKWKPFRKLKVCYTKI